MSVILIISPEPWHGHFVSKHHYALELARRGHRVLFYGPPTPEKTLTLQVVDAEGVPVTLISSPVPMRGLRLLPSVVRKLIETRWLKAIEELAGARIDVVWLFENSRFFDMRFAQDRLKLYQQMDLNQNFFPAIAARTADLTITISGPIERRLKVWSEKVLRINHGLSLSHFKDDSEIEAAFKCSQRNAVITGNLNIPYLDHKLLARLVHQHPDTNFHLVGAFTPGVGIHGLLEREPNAIFWGRQASQKLPAFLTRANVLLVTYLAEDHLEQVANSHKIMEYLAAGPVILATRTLDYVDRPDLLEMASNADEYIEKFDLILSNLDYWNSEEKVKTRKSFAYENTYAHQINKIEKALGVFGNLVAELPLAGRHRQ